MIEEAGNMERRAEYNTGISISCIVLCTILFTVFGILPLVPSYITRLLRPAAIIVSMFTLYKYYPWRRLKWQFALMMGYLFIFIINPIRSENISAFISYETFSLFFLLEANRIWNKSEIQTIFKAVVFSSTLNAVITLVSNMLSLGLSGGQHLYFLGAHINRNSLAFGIAPGVVCGLLLYIYSVHSWRVVYILSVILCSITLLYLACRSAFYSAFFGSCCLIWGKVRQNRTPAERLLKRIVLIMTIWGGLWIIIRMTSNTTSARLFVVSGDNIDTGRNDLWEQANLLIKEKPIFGGGYDYWTNAGNRMGTHNTLLTLMLAGGIVLGLLYVLMMAAIIIECAEVDLFLMMTFIIQTIAHSLSESGLDYFAYIPLILAVILQRHLKYQNNNLYRIFGG